VASRTMRTQFTGSKEDNFALAIYRLPTDLLNNHDSLLLRENHTNTLRYTRLDLRNAATATEHSILSEKFQSLRELLPLSLSHLCVSLGHEHTPQHHHCNSKHRSNGGPYRPEGLEDLTHT